MPRFFFNLYDDCTKNLVRDFDGTLLSNAGEAKKEAIGLAQDIVGHRFQLSTWQIIVTDENKDQVLKVLLSEIRARKIKAWIDLAHRIAIYEPGFRSYLFTWLLTAAVLATIILAAMLTGVSRNRAEVTGSLRFAYEGSIVEVCFVPWISVEDISQFLHAYNASFVGGPLAAGMYRIRISDTTLPHQVIAKILSQMTQEKIVAFAAAAE